MKINERFSCSLYKSPLCESFNLEIAADLCERIQCGRYRLPLNLLALPNCFSPILCSMSNKIEETVEKTENFNK